MTCERSVSCKNDKPFWETWAETGKIVQRLFQSAFYFFQKKKSKNFIKDSKGTVK